MRDFKRSQREMYYALFDKIVPQIDENGDETGDTVETYSNPIGFKASLSPGKGKVQSELFGADVKFERTISTTDMNLPISVDSLVWYETEPIFLEDGSVDPDSADYEVAAPPSRGQNVLVIALKARAKNGKVSH